MPRTLHATVSAFYEPTFLQTIVAEIDIESRDGSSGYTAGNGVRSDMTYATDGHKAVDWPRCPMKIVLSVSAITLVPCCPRMSVLLMDTHLKPPIAMMLEID